MTKTREQALSAAERLAEEWDDHGIADPTDVANAVSDVWEPKVDSLRSAVADLHGHLERVEAIRVEQGVGFIGLDHKLGENAGGCTACTAYAESADA